MVSFGNTIMHIDKQYDAGATAGEYAAGSAKNEQSDLGRAFLREQISMLDRSFRLLDVGCGNGLDLRAYKKMGFTDLYGADPSEKFLHEAALNCGKSIHLSEGAFEQLPFVDDLFDAVVSRHSLHYAHDLDRATSEVARVLKPGGKFLFVMSHPSADALLPKDSGGNVTATLFEGTVSITFPYHTLSELFSETFLHAFMLDVFYEYTGNERDGAADGIPNTLAFVATKK